MSRIAFALASGALAALVSLSVTAAPAVTKNGLPVAPNGGKTSIHQWGGIDDAFAVSPDGEGAASPSKAAPMTRSQDDADDDDPGDPDADHDSEVLAI